MSGDQMIFAWLFIIVGAGIGIELGRIARALEKIANRK